MIKLEKNINIIPQSLIPAFEDLFIDSKIPSPSRTTHTKRLLLIAAKEYYDSNEYNLRYKTKDIRSALKLIYKNKCAFCEQKVEQYNIEHYRPKSSYYWLAYSWDNLILACPTCNQGKGINFELLGNRVQFDNTEINLRNINISSSNCDIIEMPKMVNPEISNPLGYISFLKNGLIFSLDTRFAYTIEKCSIDRNYLNDERRKLLDDFGRDMQSIMVESESIEEQRIAISTIVKKFIRDSQDDELQFLAFRRYAINQDWLSHIVKELN